MATHVHKLFFAQWMLLSVLGECEPHPKRLLQVDISCDGQRHLMLASDTQLNQLAHAKIWFVDGTFKVVRSPFVQLLSAHSYIKAAGTMKQVPFLFVIVSRRKTTDYVAVVKEMLSLLPADPKVADIVVDFERAVWSGLNKCLPAVPIHGCWFHWAQAVYRKVYIKNYNYVVVCFLTVPYNFQEVDECFM